MAQHNDFGKESEELAQQFLQNKGYNILAKNWRWQKAEVDIIAKEKDIIVFVEVKARETDVFINPQEAVNKKKIKLLVLASEQFLLENEWDNEVRFDIITILGKEKSTINHIQNAFESIDAL